MLHPLVIKWNQIFKKLIIKDLIFSWSFILLWVLFLSIIIFSVCFCTYFFSFLKWCSNSYDHIVLYRLPVTVLKFLQTRCEDVVNHLKMCKLMFCSYSKGKADTVFSKWQRGLRQVSQVKPRTAAVGSFSRSTLPRSWPSITGEEKYRTEMRVIFLD